MKYRGMASFAAGMMLVNGAAAGSLVAVEPPAEGASPSVLVFDAPHAPPARGDAAGVSTLPRNHLAEMPLVIRGGLAGEAFARATGESGPAPAAPGRPIAGPL